MARDYSTGYATVRTNQQTDWPACPTKSVVAMIQLSKLPAPADLKAGFADLAAAVLNDFKMTNSHVGGKAAKFGAGLVVGGAVAAKFGAKTPLGWLRSGFGPLPHEFASKLGGGISDLQWTELGAGQRLARVALAAGVKMAFVAVAYEGGVLIGAMVNQTLSDETKDAIGGTVNQIVNEGGYKVLWEQPLGIAIKK